jgi:hypothetical protein
MMSSKKSSGRTEIANLYIESEPSDPINNNLYSREKSTKNKKQINLLLEQVLFKIQNFHAC